MPGKGHRGRCGTQGAQIDAFVIGDNRTAMVKDVRENLEPDSTPNWKQPGFAKTLLLKE